MKSSFFKPQAKQLLDAQSHQQSLCKVIGRWISLPHRVSVAVILIIWASFASAHPAPFSYLDVYLDQAGARGALVVHNFDAAHELGLNQPESLLDPAIAAAQREALIGLMESRLHISGDASPIALRWGDLEVLADRQSLRLPFSFGDRIPGRLDIKAWLFPYDAIHQSFINIHENSQLRHQAILDSHSQNMTYYGGSQQGRRAVVRSYAQAGVHHILIGPDHILFLLGLLLLGGSLWRLTSIVTAFTVGHSITLSLAALDLVRISPAIIEPTIALSIMIVGVDNLLVRAQNLRLDTPSATASARDLRPWLAAVFGLVHGFGFASVLRELGLPNVSLGWSLAAFNVGVEIGQLLIVIATAALLAWLRRRSTVAAERCVLIGSIGVIAAGAYWFVQRLWFAPIA